MLLAIPATTYVVFQTQITTSEATPATTMLFDPPTTSSGSPGPITKTVDDTFSFNILMNTGSNFVTGTEIHIKYDTSKLTGISIEKAPNAFLPNELVAGTISGGFGFITLGTDKLPGGVRGSGTLATVTFRAIVSTNGVVTPIQFTTDTAVAGANEGTTNVLVSKPPPSAYLMINPVGPTSTPTLTPTATPSVTPTPTRAAGAITLIPTPTRIATVSATPTTTRVPTPTTNVVVAPSTQPTTGAIPVTADITPTAALTIAGALLFVLGAISILFL